MKNIARLISLGSDGAAVLAGIATILLVVHVSTDVVLRYVFNAPLSGTILYVSAFYMVAIAFFPQALVEKDDNHISVELLYDFLPAGSQKAILGVSFLLTAIVGALISVRTGQEALSKYALGTFSLEGRTRIITWPTYFFPPIGFGLLTIVALWKTLAIVLGFESGMQRRDPIAEVLAEDEPNV